MRRDDVAAPVLEAQGVRKCFTLHLRDGLRLPVLEGIDLSVQAGECVALVGPSGRGKSTLVKCLYGSYGVDGGRLLLRRGGQPPIDLAGASPRELLALRRQAIGYVSQFLRALPRQPAIDVVAQRLLDAGAPVHDLQADPLDDAPHEAALADARATAGALLARLNLPRSLWGPAAGDLLGRRAAARQHRTRLRRAGRPAAARRADRFPGCRQSPCRGRTDPRGQGPWQRDRRHLP